MKSTSNVVYLENVVENTAYLTPELQRMLETVKMLDSKTENIKNDLNEWKDKLLGMPPEADNKGEEQMQDYLDLLQRVEDNSKMVLRLADEKVHIVNQIQELLEYHQNQLELDMDCLDNELRTTPLDFDLPDFPSSFAYKMDEFAEPIVPTTAPRPRRQQGRNERPEKIQRQDSGFTGDITSSIPTPLVEAQESQTYIYPYLMEKFPPQMLERAPKPQVPGTIFNKSDILPSLKGRIAELFWPDDENWYAVEITDVDVANGSAKIVYVTGEVEELDLCEIAENKHMSLIVQRT